MHYLEYCRILTISYIVAFPKKNLNTSKRKREYSVKEKNKFPENIH